MKTLCFFMLLGAMLGCTKQFIDIKIDTNPSSKLKTRYFKEDKTALVSSKYGDLKHIENGVKYIYIMERKCILTNEIPYLQNLKEISILATKLKFNEIFFNPDSLNLLSIHEHVFDKIPDVFYKLGNLDFLLITVRDAQVLARIDNFPKLTYLDVNVVHAGAFPEKIGQLPLLKELRIKLVNEKDSYVKIEALRNLQHLEVLKAPIDLSENLDVILSLKKLKKLFVKSFSNLELEQLKKLSNLEQIYVKEITDEGRVMFSEILPNVRFLQDSHI
jgi:hypothetical protein